MMKQTPALVFLLSLALWVGGNGCGSDTSEANNDLREQLIGRWNVREAIFQNRPTNRLDGAYIEFRLDGTLYTNLTGVRQQGTWTLEGEVLEQQLPGLDVRCRLVGMQDSLLMMTMQVRNAQYKLLLERHREETATPPEAPVQ